MFSFVELFYFLLNSQKSVSSLQYAHDDQNQIALYIRWYDQWLINFINVFRTEHRTDNLIVFIDWSNIKIPKLYEYHYHSKQ